MSLRFLAAAALAVAALFTVVPRADAGTSRQIVRGKMAAVDADSNAKGRFRMAVVDRENGRHWERIEAFARRLHTPGQDHPPYHVFLVKSGGAGEADFGAMKTNRWGFAFFLFDTRSDRDDLPPGVSTITDFGGGAIEVRDGSGAAVLRGSIPVFGEAGAGSATFGRDREPLVAVDAAFSGKGVIVARRMVYPLHTEEVVRVEVSGMANATTYTAVAIAADSTVIQLGTFTTSDPLGLGGFRLATSEGATIPGGGVKALAGDVVEIRDASGTAVLRGTFPSIP